MGVIEQKDDEDYARAFVTKLGKTNRTLQGRIYQGLCQSHTPTVRPSIESQQQDGGSRDSQTASFKGFNLQ
jgi:hypothetical protein